MTDKGIVDAVKAIPIPDYMAVVAEVAPSLEGADVDLYYKNTIPCPCHNERTASFRWYEMENTCYCFGCGVGGDIITLHMKIMYANEDRRVSFDEAVEYLYRRFVKDTPLETKAVVVHEEVSHAELVRFEHAVLNRADKEEFKIAEDLHLLIRLGRITGGQAVKYFNQVVRGQER